MTIHMSIEDGVGRVVLDDPPVNILTRRVMSRLRRELDGLAAARELRVVVLSAEGKHFSAGASVEEHLPDQVGEMIPEFMETIEALQDFPLPTISAVQGRCLGGAFELALATDLIVAGEGALFAVPEIHLGVLPPAACVQLAEKAGPSLAAELIFTGDPKNARELADAGLLARVVPDGEVLDQALALAGSITRHSAAALRATKHAVLAGRSPWTTSRPAVTSIYLNDLMSTRDAVEGLMSFVEKRQPEWSHS